MFYNYDDNYESKCPYCYKQKNIHQLSKLLTNKPQNSISYSICLNCNNKYYYISDTIKINKSPSSFSIGQLFDTYKDIDLTFTQEIYDKKYKTNQLLNYLPTQELKTRYLDLLLSCNRINPKYMTLRGINRRLYSL